MAKSPKFTLAGTDYQIARAGLKQGLITPVIAMKIVADHIEAGVGGIVPMFAIEAAVELLKTTPYELTIDGEVVGHKATERAANMAMNKAANAGSQKAGWELLAKI